MPADEDTLTRAIIALASEYGRCGYRRITALLLAAGCAIEGPRPAHLASRGAEIPKRHQPHSRFWLNDGSSVRLRSLPRNQLWSFDFVQAQPRDGRSLQVLTLIDKHTRAYLALKVACRINSIGVIEALADAMGLCGIPEHIPSACSRACTTASGSTLRWTTGHQRSAAQQQVNDAASLQSLISRRRGSHTIVP